MARTTYSLNDNYSIKKITDLKDFYKLKIAWDKLSEKQESYNPFLCFDWFRIWLNHFKETHKIFILFLYENKSVECIAPFLIKTEIFKGLRVKKLELIGNAYSPVKTFIFKEFDNESKKEELISAIFKYIFQNSEYWDVIDLNAIPIEKNTFEIFKNSIRKSGMNYAEYFCFWNWHSDEMNYSSDQYFKSRSKNLRASLKKNYRNAKYQGKINFKIVKNTDCLNKYIEEYLEVYKQSWKREEHIGPEFVINWIKKSADAQWLRLGLVYLDNLPISSGFAVICKKTAYLEKTAFDDKYKKIGPGSIWLSEMVKYIVDSDKVSFIDLLRGDEEYKRHWVDKRRERKGIFIFNNNVKGCCLSILIQHVLPVVNKSETLRKIKIFFKSVFLRSCLRSGE